MNKGSRKVRTLYIKSFSDVVLNWRGCRCCLDVERPSAPSTICLFGCLACVSGRWSLLFVRRDIGVFLFKFRSVLKHGKIACNKITKTTFLGVGGYSFL